MNKPALYHKSHSNFKDGMGRIIKENFSKIQWRRNGGDKFCDVGTGPGDFFMEYIYPLMPTNFEKLVLSDISADMLEYAKNTYGAVEKCEFKILDIATKAELPSEMKGKFDHVTAIMVLHWVPDIRTALWNIFQLLRSEGGDCLLIFMPTNAHGFAYDQLKETKWSKYLNDVDRFKSPLHYSSDAKREFTDLMKEAGFSNISVELQHKKLIYDNIEDMKDQQKSVCGPLDDIPATLQSEFMDDFVTIMSEYAARSEKTSDPMQSKCYAMSYDLIIAYGQKVPSENNLN